MSTDTTEITAIINSIKNDDSDQINWDYFVLAARLQIINSSAQFESLPHLRKFWLLTAKTISSALGLTLNTGSDNWHLIERDLRSFYDSTTKSLQSPSTDAATSKKSRPPSSSTSTTSTRAGVESVQSGSDSVSESASTSSTSQSDTAIKLPALTDLDKLKILATYDALDTKRMWKLSTGTVVEEKMRQCALSKNHEHLSHSLIFNAQDSEWLEYFTEEEIAEIKDHNSVDLPPVPQELASYLHQLQSMSPPDVYAKVTNESFPLESDCKWAQDSIYQAFRLLRSGFLNVKNVTEGGLIKRVWSCIDSCFDFSTITCISGEKCSSSSADAMNAARSNLLSRQSSGRKMDYLFFDTDNEVGCGECGLVGGTNTTKELCDAMFKMPKVMKDMLIKLVSVSPALKNDLVVTGFYIGEYKLKLLVLDCPSEYVTRIDAMNDLFYPKNETQLYRKMSAILQGVLGAKILMENTASKLATDTTEIVVGKSKVNSKVGNMVPCFIPSAINKRRKRGNQ